MPEILYGNDGSLPASVWDQIYDSYTEARMEREREVYEERAALYNLDSDSLMYV